MLELLAMYFSPSSPLSIPYIPLSTLFSNFFNLRYFLKVRDQVSHPYITKFKA
jgi:hypothetical protein